LSLSLQKRALSCRSENPKQCPHGSLLLLLCPYSGLLLPRPLPTVEWLAGRAAGGDRTATPHAHAMNPSAAGIQMRSVYSGSIALTSSRSSRCSVQETGSALCELSVLGVTCKIP